MHHVIAIQNLSRFSIIQRLKNQNYTWGSLQNLCVEFFDRRLWCGLWIRIFCTSCKQTYEVGTWFSHKKSKAISDSTSWMLLVAGKLLPHKHWQLLRRHLRVTNLTSYGFRDEQVRCRWCAPIMGVLYKAFSAW